MNVTIQIDLNRFDKIPLKEAMDAIESLKPQALDAVGVETMKWLVGWYKEKGNDYFDNPGNLTHGAGRQETRWAEGLTHGWSSTSTNEEAVIGFMYPTKPGSFYYKVHGGTISTKEKKALTIPINPLAHGRRVSDLEAYLGVDVFRPYREGGRKADYLAAQIQGEGLVPLYALRKSVHVDPWPNAVPDETDIRAAATHAAFTFFLQGFDGK